MITTKLQQHIKQLDKEKDYSKKLILIGELRMELDKLTKVIAKKMV